MHVVCSNTAAVGARTPSQKQYELFINNKTLLHTQAVFDSGVSCQTCIVGRATVSRPRCANGLLPGCGQSWTIPCFRGLPTLNLGPVPLRRLSPVPEAAQVL